MRSTTIIGVKQGEKVALAGDGQVSMGDTIMKRGAVKVRRLYDGKVAAGFAGTSADAITLFEKFESKLEEFHGNIKRSAVELAKEWRTDRVLRRLEALIIVADRENLFIISGNGDVIEPDDGVAAIGSGGPYALAAARALIANTDFSAEEIARQAMTIASEICVYTNNEVNVEVME